MTYAVCTLITCPDDITAAIVLAKSIMLNNPNYKRICMTTIDVQHDKRLKEYYDIIRNVDTLPNGLTKWSMLSFIEYTKILYLDPHIIVTKDISSLFQLSTPSTIFGHLNAKCVTFNDYIDNSNPWTIGGKMLPRGTTITHQAVLETSDDAMCNYILLVSPSISIYQEMLTLLEHKSYDHLAGRLYSKNNSINWTQLGSEHIVDASSYIVPDDTLLYKYTNANAIPMTDDRFRAYKDIL